jgi:hypothetical protein
MRDPQCPSFATGLVYKKGKFSAIEEQQLLNAIQVYKEVGPVTPHARLSLIVVA